VINYTEVIVRLVESLNSRTDLSYTDIVTKALREYRQMEILGVFNSDYRLLEKILKDSTIDGINFKELNETYSKVIEYSKKLELSQNQKVLSQNLSDMAYNQQTGSTSSRQIINKTPEEQAIFDKVVKQMKEQTSYQSSSDFAQVDTYTETPLSSIFDDIASKFSLSNTTKQKRK